MATSGQNVGETSTAGRWFKTTHWSVVLDAQQKDSTRASAALAKLCEVYWPPLYGYIRQVGHGPEDAKDFTQEFFARLLEKDYLKAVDREKGKFRTFLLMATKRFLANEWDRANRHKRGGGRKVISLDETDAEDLLQAEFADHETPERVFDQRWATTLLQQVITRLETEMATDKKQQLFKELRGFLSGEKDRNSYAEAAGRLRMSEGTLRVNIHRFRQRYRELLRLEIGDTVDSPEAIGDEIRHLFATFS